MEDAPTKLKAPAHTSQDQRNKKQKCIEVYYDENTGMESFVVNNWYVERRRNPYNDLPVFDRFLPFPVSGSAEAARPVQRSPHSQGLLGLNLCVFDFFIFHFHSSRYTKIPTSIPPTRPTSKYPAEELKEADSPQTLGTAQLALEYYNKKHHTDYKLVEAVCSNANSDFVGCWVHCNFRAKPGDGGNGDLSTKLFFAERKLVKLGPPTRFAITACSILDGVKTTSGCGMCRSGCPVLHPAGGRGFRKGRYHHQRRDLRSWTKPFRTS